MGFVRIFVACLLATGCLPRPEPAQPQPQYAPQYAQPQYAQPQQPQQTQQQPMQQQPMQQPPAPTTEQPAPPATTTAQGGVTVTAAANSQPAPPPLPASYQQQPGYYPPPYQQPYAYPPPAPYPAPMITASETGRRRLHDGEVIADFAVVGTFGALDVLSRQNLDNGSAIGFLLVAGAVGGGGVGYLLTNRYDVDGGSAHATTLGLTLGFANGALLIQPTGWEESPSVLNLMFLGSAAGAAGGFIYGQNARPTSGQSLFIANLALLGSATAALTAIAGSRDGTYGGWENGALAVGLDGGTVAGAVIAPSLDWSAKRSKVVLASTTIGALAGGMFAGLVANNNGESRTDNGDVVTGAMTAGLWGGFALGIMMTKQYNPDPKFAQPTAPTRTAAKAASPTTIVPWVGTSGRLGVMTGGSF